MIKFIQNKKALIMALCFAAAGLGAAAQAYNAGPINISGSAYLASSFTNTVAATYLNNGSLSLTGDFTNNQSGMSAGTGTITFLGTSLENINGAQPSNFYNATTNNTANVKMGKDITINNIFYPQAGSLQINGNNLNLAGTINNAGTGTISGDASAAGSSNINITGTGALGTMNFYSTNYYINNLTLNRTSSGTATMGTQLYVYGTAAMNNGALVLNTNTLSLSGSVTGTGTFTGDNSATMNVLGTSSTSLGTLYFTSGGTGQNLKTFNINRWNSTTVANAATLGTNLTATNLGLTYGVLSTGYNLMTVASSAGISAPNIPWTSGSTTFGNSYVATCDATGTPLSQANNTTPLSNSIGFQINNVGPASGDVYFPVGASFTPAGTGFSAPTPDRMMLNMNSGGTATNFNVVVNYGDIDNTPNPRVSRIWYVNAADTTAANRKVNMKLFFVGRNTANWSTIENEVENTPYPFDYTNVALIERDYSATDPNFIAESSGSDIKSFGSYLGNELYAQYTVGVSADVGGNKNGIYQFNRFSITNPGGIILSVKIINFTAYQQGSGVQTGWTCLNEINMDHYELQRSADAVNFSTIGSVAALDNGQPSVNYGYFDKMPLQGNNFYRVKAIGKDGSITYTSVAVVVIGGGNSNINIFPNPVTNHNFVVQMVNIPAGKYQLEVYNSLGQLLQNNEIDHAGGSASQTVYLPSGTARGEYHVILLGTAMRITKMITVE